jgi:hypothetical protein
MSRHQKQGCHIRSRKFPTWRLDHSGAGPSPPRSISRRLSIQGKSAFPFQKQTRGLPLRSRSSPSEREARALSPSLRFRAAPFLNFIFISCGSGVVYQHRRQRTLRHSTQESVMKFVFIIAIVFLGITTAQGQTVLQLSGPTNSSESAVGSDPLSEPTSSLPSVSSPSPASQLGTASGSPTTTGSASGATGATSSASGISQSPFLLPGEIPDTSTQASSTTATAPSTSSPICPPPVPSTDGGSTNLSEIAGAPLNGC